MSETNDKKPKKEPLEMISVRIGKSLKKSIDEIADKSPLAASDISRMALYAGMESIYNVKMVGHNVVDK